MNADAAKPGGAASREVLGQMRHILYDIIDELGLSDKPIEYIKRELMNLAPEEVNGLLDRLEDWYGANLPRLLGGRGRDSQSCLWMPRLRCGNILELTGRFITTDIIYCDDPLYNVLCYLAAAGEVGSFANFFASESSIDFSSYVVDVYGRKFWDGVVDAFQHNPLPELEEYGDYVFQEVVLDYAAQAILALEKVKDFVLEDKLIIFVNPNARGDATPIVRALDLPELAKQKSLKGNEEYFKECLDLLFENDFKGLISKDFFYGDMRSVCDTLETLVSFSYGLFYSNPPTQNIDILDNSTYQLLDRLTLARKRPELLGSVKRLPAALSANTLLAPSLAGLPPQEALDANQKARDDLERFRYRLLMEAAQITAPPGSEEWERQIYNCRLKLAKDVKSLQDALGRLRSDYTRKLGTDVMFVLASITLAAMAASGKQLDAASLFQSVAGGAGLIASLRAMFGHWLGLRKEQNALEHSDHYFLWKYGKGTDKPL
ncbi:hypothetical protein AAU61_02025 [Desulfocarbo indianensis]|nr:hypothetical protein AAU61_02025 [Desulfocarbo indianensis]